GSNLGLLYGQGGFVTKHHALVLSRQPPRQTLRQDTNVQAEADRHRRKVPEFVTEASGKGKVESFTVIYRGNGEVEHGVVMLRASDARPEAISMSRPRSRAIATVLNSTLSSPPTVATRRPFWLKISALAGMCSGTASRCKVSRTLA